jgi:hypothetical protein
MSTHWNSVIQFQGKLLASLSPRENFRKARPFAGGCQGSAIEKYEYFPVLRAVTVGRSHKGKYNDLSCGLI